MVTLANKNVIASPRATGRVKHIYTFLQVLIQELSPLLLDLRSTVSLDEVLSLIDRVGLLLFFLSNLLLQRWWIVRWAKPTLLGADQSSDSRAVLLS